MSERIKFELYRQGLRKVKSEIINIEVSNDGINLPATGTMTFKSALLLSRKLKNIVDNHIKEQYDV